MKRNDKEKKSNDIQSRVTCEILQKFESRLRRNDTYDTNRIKKQAIFFLL